MNKTVTLAALVAIIATGLVTFVDRQQKPQLSLELGLMHQNWMLTEGKLYSSPAEQSYRLSIFQENLEMIKAHNADSSKTWTMGLNQFADMTAEEVAAKYLGVTEENLAELDGAEYYVPEPTLQQSGSVDWTKFSPKVLNQGSCGSCWAFGGAATAEITYNKLKGTSYTFSPQQPLDCTQWSCSGGWPQDVETLYTKSSPVLLENYPYSAVKKACQAPASNLQKAKSVRMLTQSKNDHLSALNVGPLNMVYCVNSPFMMYKGGIFNDSTCCQTKKGLHAVSIVGYNSAANPPYFLVRNSWGASWGEQGYFRIQISDVGNGICDMYMKSSSVTF